MNHSGWMERQMQRATETVASWPEAKREVMSLEPHCECEFNRKLYGGFHIGNNGKPYCNSCQRRIK